MGKMRKVFAMRKNAEKRILRENSRLPNLPGIYVFVRTSEEGIKYAYVGQAKNMLERCVAHLMNYQAIDLSIKKHGLYDQQKNPYGYRIHVYKQCPVEMLDEYERQAIRYCAEKGYQLKNKTSGGQGEGKVGIADNKPSRGYRDGVAQGYKNCQRDVRVFFDKYLDYSIKGKPNKIKERKLKEFEELIDGN